jgi:hypothetical protein
MSVVMFTDDGDERREVLANALRRDVAAFANGDIDIVEAEVRGCLGQFFAGDELQVFGEDGDLELLAGARPGQAEEDRSAREQGSPGDQAAFVFVWCHRSPDLPYYNAKKSGARIDQGVVADRPARRLRANSQRVMEEGSVPLEKEFDGRRPQPAAPSPRSPSNSSAAEPGSGVAAELVKPSNS